MKEMRKELRKILAVTGYALMVALFFFGGYAMGGRTVENEPLPIISAEPAEPAAKTGTVQEPRTGYELIAEDEMLRLYRIDGAKRDMAAQEQISLELFPYEDRETLKEGVFFDELGEAQAMFENFVS